MEEFSIVGGEDVILGRSEKQIREWGKRGTGFIGRVVMSKGNVPVLGRRVFLDLANPHVILIAGKRGYGKSYTLGVLIEEFHALPAAVKSRIAVVIIDTVGIFWTMKIPNEGQRRMLEEWGLEPEGIEIDVLVPKGRYEFYKKHGLPVDGYFSIRTSELGPEEWLSLFGLSMDEPIGIALANTVARVMEERGEYGIEDLEEAVRNDPEMKQELKDAVLARLRIAKTWGLFEKEGEKITSLARPGRITAIDVSTYRQVMGAQGIREVIVGLLGKKLFEERMVYRKVEELKQIKEGRAVSEMPLVWMIIDEAHLFMPNDRKSLARDVLIDWIRVGRQPGLSLVLATQRLDKLDENVISQSDIVLFHRMTSRLDLDALNVLKPTYIHQDLSKYVGDLPSTRGLAVILDDNSEKLWLVKIRPRKSWHGGGSPSALVRWI